MYLSASLALCFVSLSPSQLPEPQVTCALHAVWTPNLTVNQPQSQCVTSGTVAAPHFHFYVGWKGPLAFLVVDWILVEELTNEHKPQIWYFANPQGSNGFPQGCSMLPVSDPQNWRWMTWHFPMTAGFWMHNSPYRVTVQWRYWVQMKGQRGPFQTSIEVNVQNLVVTSGDVGKVLKWDPERPELCDTSFGYSIICAQRKQVQVKISIYSMDGVKVYELTEQKICPGSYNFTWDGSMNTGYYGGSYEPTNVAPSGLYTFDVEVIGPAYYYDADWVRSKDLRVVPGPVEYYGYDDNGTPEDESDDSHLYYLRWYALYSGRDATWGEIWLYDPDFEMVGAWAVPMLTCVVHGWNDGLEANPNGEVHGVIIPVPVSVMEKAGKYRFVLHFYDNYADIYKNHQVKAALEVNAYVQSVYEVYPCICPDKVHYPDRGDGKDCNCYHNKLGCANCPAFQNYCPAQTCLGGKHPECQCANYRTCQPNNCSLCHAIRSRLGSVFNSPGYVQAKGYGQVEFYVKLIVRKVMLNGASRPNWHIGIQLRRPKPKTDGETKGREIASPWKSEGSMLIWSDTWKVTRLKGRWEMWVAGQKEIFKDFKIDKRAQIVITAESWVGARITSAHEACSDLVGRIYNHVGISVKGENVSKLWDSTKEYGGKDQQHAATVFYGKITPPGAPWGHAAIRVTLGLIVDVNCDLIKDPDLVRKHDENEHLPKRLIKEDRTPKELIDLDGE